MGPQQPLTTLVAKPAKFQLQNVHSLFAHSFFIIVIDPFFARGNQEDGEPVVAVADASPATSSGDTTVATSTTATTGAIAASGSGAGAAAEGRNVLLGAVAGLGSALTGTSGPLLFIPLLLIFSSPATPPREAVALSQVPLWNATLDCLFAPDSPPSNQHRSHLALLLPRNAGCGSAHGACHDHRQRSRAAEGGPGLGLGRGRVHQCYGASRGTWDPPPRGAARPRAREQPRYGGYRPRPRGDWSVHGDKAAVLEAFKGLGDGDSNVEREFAALLALQENGR